MTVSIDLGNYKITTNESNWILSKRKGKTWQALYYYSSLAGLLNGLGELRLRELPAGSFEEISLNLRDIRLELEEIKKQLKFST